MPGPREDSPFRLIVEGPDDKWSVINLLKRHGFDWDDPKIDRPFVKEAGGITNLLRQADLRTAVKACTKLGIVIDADLKVLDRWTAVRNTIQALQIALPLAPAPEGVVVDHGKDGSKRFGIWMMPDNVSPGILENFIARLIPSGDSVHGHAESSTRVARELGAPLAPKDHVKGMIHAWLAWQSDPGMPFGSALNANILRHDSNEALAFVAWFRRLFATSALASQQELGPTGSTGP